MPSTIIKYEKGEVHAFRDGHSQMIEGACVVSSPLGLVLLDIQGELNLPHENSKDRYERATADQVHEAVRFGRIEFDKSNLSRVTLFIGESQRLVGKVVELPRPIGILRISNLSDEAKTSSSQNIDLIDIVKKKMLFDQRPLPIM